MDEPGVGLEHYVRTLIAEPFFFEAINGVSNK